MAETVQDVFDELLGQYKAGLMLTVPHSPRASEEAELIPAVLSYYRQHFEAARDAEKGSKSTPLTDQQKKCPYCHEDICAGADPWVGRVGKDMLADDGQSQVYVSIEHPGHLMVVDYEGTTDSAPINYCPMCGRKLGGPK